MGGKRAVQSPPEVTLWVARGQKTSVFLIDVVECGLDGLTNEMLRQIKELLVKER